MPTPGGPDDFAELVRTMKSLNVERSSPVVHALFATRWALGRVFGWDGPSGDVDAPVASLRERLPADLKDASPGSEPGMRFDALYVTGDEAAFEIVNHTMHGVMHLGWVPDGTGRFHGQMAVLVKPNGVFGAGYLAAIAPFRHLIVYPTLLRAVGETWLAGSTATTVRKIRATSDIRELSNLPRVDYADAFVVEIPDCPQWTAHRWATAVLEEAPAATRATLTAGWTALGLTSVATAGSMLGWHVRHHDPDMLLLARASMVGMPGELLFRRRANGLLFATFVHHHTAATRVLWRGVEPVHVRTVSALLQRAARAAAREVTESAGAG